MPRIDCDSPQGTTLQVRVHQGSKTNVKFRWFFTQIKLTYIHAFSSTTNVSLFLVFSASELTLDWPEVPSWAAMVERPARMAVLRPRGVDRLGC